MTNIYQIKKFDPSSIRNTSVSAIIGKRECGKTTLAKDIINHKEIAQNIVIDPASDYQQNYNNIVANEFIHQEYGSKLVENIIKSQNNLETVRLIMDNCDMHLCEKNIHNLFTNHRLYNINILLTLQNMLELKPVIRNNIDYLFIFPSSLSAMNNMKKIYEPISHLFESYEHFYTVLNQCTQNNYECLVINYVSDSDKMEDKVFWYKADIHEENSLVNETDIDEDNLFTYAFNIFRYIFCL